MSYTAYVYPAGEGPPRVYRRDGILQVLTRKGRSFQLSEILRLKGELLLMRSKTRLREAEACFRESIEVADRQGAKLPKLRSATRLARLLADRGDVREALSLLRPAYDAIIGGRDLADMRTTAALLADLRNE